MQSLPSQREKFLMQQEDPALRAKSRDAIHRIVDALIEGDTTKVQHSDLLMTVAVISERLMVPLFKRIGEKNLLAGFGNAIASQVDKDVNAKESQDSYITDSGVDYSEW